MQASLKYLLIITSVFLYSIQTNAEVSPLLDSLYTLVASTQDDLELANIYYQIYDEKFRLNDKSEIRYTVDMCKKHALDSGDRQAQVKCEVLEARLLYWEGQYKESHAACKSVEALAQKANMPLVQAKMLGMMADIQGILGNYLDGLGLAQQTLEIRLANAASQEEIAAGYANIANFHGAINNLEQSTAYYKKARAIYSQAGDDLMAARMLMYMGLDRSIATEYDEARDLLTESLESFRQIKDNNSIIDALSKLGSVEQLVGKFDKAQAHYDEAQTLCIIAGNDLDLSILYQRNAHLNVDKKDWSKAIAYCEKALPISTDIGDRESLRRIYEYLYKSYKALGNYDLAFENLEHFTALNDSLSNSQTISKINALELKFQTDQKESAILLLKEKNKVSSYKARGLVLGLLTISALFVVFAFAMRQRIKKKELQKEKLAQKLVFRDEELILKKKELSAYALQLAQKNKILEGIKVDVKNIKAKAESTKSLQKIVQSIDFSQNDDRSWDGFRSRFLEVHKDFEVNAKAKYPTLTNNEMKFISLIKMSLSSKEIASILNVSSEGIKKTRYRLRKKLNLKPVESLEALIHKL